MQLPSKEPRLRRHETVVAVTTKCTATNKARNEYRGMTTNAPATVPCSPIVMAVEGSLFGDTWCPASIKSLIAQYAWDALTCVPKWRHQPLQWLEGGLADIRAGYCLRGLNRVDPGGIWFADHEMPRVRYLLVKRHAALDGWDPDLLDWLQFLEAMARCKKY
jgi:hypothetical protein